MYNNQQDQPRMGITIRMVIVIVICTIIVVLAKVHYDQWYIGQIIKRIKQEQRQNHSTDKQ